MLRQTSSPASLNFGIQQTSQCKCEVVSNNKEPPHLSLHVIAHRRSKQHKEGVQRGEANVPLSGSTMSPLNSQQLNLNSFHSLCSLLTGLILRTTTRQAAAHVLITVFQRRGYWWNKRPGSSKARAAGQQGFHSLRSDS